MARGYDSNEQKRLTVLVTHKVNDLIASASQRRGILRETFIREAIEAHLRNAEQADG